MLFAHEVHRVVGARESEFESAFRDEWMPRLGKDDDARLLWYCRQVHGTGPAYTVLTITAVRDGAALERLVQRVQRGDLREWTAAVDECRYRVDAKLLVPVEWSPLQEVELAGVPVGAEEHPLSLYLEDTGWPHAPLADYIDFWGRSYYPTIHSRPRAERLLEIEASFQPAYGAGRRREAILWQKIVSEERLLTLLTDDPNPELLRPGAFMHEALTFRDQWESRLLRTSSWSPLF